MAFANQQVLVTGATGFLGGALALRLAADGVRVRALARSPNKATFLRERAIEVCLGDVTDPDAMRRAAEDCHVVFHVAAALGGNYAHQQAVNVEGTRNVLQAAIAADAQRFVYVSTVAVYGYNYAGDVTEDMALAPGADPYPITKGAAERVVCSGRIPYTIVRPGMIYGAGSITWTKLLFKLARLNPTPFVGDGRGSTYPIHVDDVVDLLIVAAQHPAAAGQIFNCTPDPSSTWREFLGCYSRLAGHNNWLALPVLPFALIAGLVGRVAPRTSQMHDLPDLVSFFQRRVTYKMEKARDLLGWTPRIDLEMGIAGCVPWLREQGLLR